MLISIAENGNKKLQPRELRKKTHTHIYIYRGVDGTHPHIVYSITFTFAGICHSAQWHVASNPGGGDLLEPSRRLGLARTIPEAWWQGCSLMMSDVVFEDFWV